MKEVMAKVAELVQKISKKGLKQVILVREDLKLPKGKMAAQAAHASVSAVLESQSRGKKELVRKWADSGMMKIVLRVSDEKALKEYQKIAEEKDIITSLISDAGRTVVEPGTVTCLAIGPDAERKIDSVTGKLSVY